MKRLTLTLHHDHDAECPADFDGWKLFSFCTQHVNFRHPDEFGIRRDGTSDQIGFRRKLEVGTAFILCYFEHGNSCWFHADERPAGTEGDFRWDGVSVAGVLVWEQPVSGLGSKTFDERKDDARKFLETYTASANGEAYGYTLENEDGELIDSCFGYFDAEYMFSEIRQHTNDAEVNVQGEAKWLADCHSVQEEAVA